MHEKRSIPVLYSAQEIAERVESLAAELTSQIPQEFLMVSLLRGSFMFTADLARALSGMGIHPRIDFMTLTSYGSATESSGTVTISRDISEEVKGASVLIIDDILETGRTLGFAMNLLQSRGASSIKTAVLLEKPGKRAVDIRADFVGFTVPDKFVVGYGLDYANHYRELPFIGYLDVH
jgi:hypoxanthine phosphoribosyltransferase